MEVEMEMEMERKRESRREEESRAYRSQSNNPQPSSSACSPERVKGEVDEQVEDASSGHMEHHLLFSTNAPPSSSSVSKAEIALCHCAKSQTSGSCSLDERGRIVWEGQEKMRTL